MTKHILGAACAVLFMLGAMAPAVAQPNDAAAMFEAPLAIDDLDTIRGLGAASTGSGTPTPNPFSSLFGVAAPFVPGGPIISNAFAKALPPKPKEDFAATVSNVLKTHHDTVKNAINNVR